MKLEIFDFNSAPIRVMLRDGEPWFVAVDVCRVLELTNPTESTRGLDGDESITLSNPEGNPREGVPHQLRLVSESGLYALVFKSRKPEAKAFRRWVTGEVLPAIRRTGAYQAPAVTEPDKISLFRFLREEGAHWPLNRQTEFGLAARHFAKAMGLVFEVAEEAGLGRVFVFPRTLLDMVKASTVRAGSALDSERVAFGAFLEQLEVAGKGSYGTEAARELARSSGLFPRIFNQGGSVESERSAFGRLCERFNGHRFPGGLCMRVRGVALRRRYEVARHGSERALSG